MATLLTAQLAQLAANSKASLNLKAEKASHSKSLLFEPREAAAQSFQTLFTLCRAGFDDLCQLDGRFAPFTATLFSEQSRDEDRTQLSEAENAALDKRIEAFLRLVGAKLRVLPAIKALEWLVRRFRVHEYNTTILLLTFLPYHTIPAFVTLLSILPAKIPDEFRFLRPYIQSATSPPRPVVVRHAIQHAPFVSLVSEYVLESCRYQLQHPTLLAFWAGLLTETLGADIDNLKSGRRAVQQDNQQSLLHQYGPIIGEAMTMKKVPDAQIAAYMAVSILASKGDLDDGALLAFMEQLLGNVTNESVAAGLACLVILSQVRSSSRLPSKIVKALLKIQDIPQKLVEIGRLRRVDKLANGLCRGCIERLGKKGDVRAMAVVKSLLLNQVLTDKQTTSLVQALLSVAREIDGEIENANIIRRDLGSLFVEFSRIEGHIGNVIQAALQGADVDMEELEMRLDVSIRPARIQQDTKMENGVEDVAPVESKKDLLSKLTSTGDRLATSLSSNAGPAFEECLRLFLLLALESIQDPSAMTSLEALPCLRRTLAIEDPTYLSFLIRIWCGPYPALARHTALTMAISRLKDANGLPPDLLTIAPYALVALFDSSTKVRRTAADLVAVIAEDLDASASSTKESLWSPSKFYDGKPTDMPNAEHMLYALKTLVFPALEMCILDPNHILAVFGYGLDKKRDGSAEKSDHIPQSVRVSFASSLALHIIHTPILLVKTRLLGALNSVKSSKAIPRTALLLPTLRWWRALNSDAATQLCAIERLEEDVVDGAFVGVVLLNDKEGLEFLLSAVKDPKMTERPGLLQAILNALRAGWSSMKSDTRKSVALSMLDIVLDSSSRLSDETQDGAADLLRSVELSTDILLAMMGCLPTGWAFNPESPASKRRRTAATESSRGIPVQANPEISNILKDITFVLQLVEASNPPSHPELLEPLFSTLSEIQHCGVAFGTEQGYLQTQILKCLLAMMPTYQSNKALKIDSSRSHGDLLVKCVQQSSSPTVQNAALLLIASLATTAPELVIHSVMPIFTFMGGSVLRQSDDYSANVVNQTIKEVLPPLLESIRKSKRNPVAGASDLLLSFTTAYEHVPHHRKQGVFTSLVETLGPQEFLFALLAMLVDKYGTTDSLVAFVLELLHRFDVEVQLETLVKYLHLIADLFKPKPTLSSTLLGYGEQNENVRAADLALPQLSAFTKLLTSKKLKQEIGQLAGQDDMQAAKARELYSTLLEDILLLADTVKTDKVLQDQLGYSLSNLLNLLSIGEFIKAVENLLGRPSISLRQKVLRALEIRLDQESNSDAKARTALLTFLPELTTAIRNTDDIRYKHTAVTCIDKIAEKYGKKDIEAVAAAAATIAGEHCLGQSDRRLRLMSLMCLASLVDVLQDGIVPVLSFAVPLTLMYLERSVTGEEVDEELHNAAYAFVTALAEHLPYMISGADLDRVLAASNLSAGLSLDDESKDSRKECLQFLARQVDAKTVFGALEKSWPGAVAAGYEAVGEYLEILGMAIDKHTKAVITKNVTTLSSIFLGIFDLRRQKNGEGNMQRLAAVEAAAVAVALKMVYKLNDSTFRPVFSHWIEWASIQLPKDPRGQTLRQQSLYGFLQVFFSTLKSIVTGYSLYIIEDAPKILKSVDLKDSQARDLWRGVLKTLTQCFEHDEDDFWQAPSHFGAVAMTLVGQFGKAAGAPASVDFGTELTPAVVELAAAADSQEHQKELNTALLKHLRAEAAAVRLAAVRAQQGLVQRLGEEWLAMLPEMLPYISELQEDDDEVVERETMKWIVLIEGVLGESLDSMLQ